MWSGRLSCFRMADLRYSTPGGVTVHIYDDASRDEPGGRRVLLFVPEDRFIHSHWLRASEQDPGDVARDRTFLFPIKKTATTAELQAFIDDNEDDLLAVAANFTGTTVRGDGHKRAEWAPGTPGIIGRLTAAANQALPASLSVLRR